MAQDQDKKSESGSASGNGGKKYLEDKKALEESIDGLKSQSEGHENRLKTVETQVIEINSKVSVLDEIRKGTNKIQEVVIRMDEKQGNFLTKEAYLQDQVTSAKEEMVEVTGVHKMPKAPEEGGWKKAYTIIAVVAGILGLLTTLGVSIVVRPDAEAAALSDEANKNLVNHPEVKTLMDQQRLLIENINKLIQAHGAKVDEPKSNAVTANENKSATGG